MHQSVMDWVTSRQPLAPRRVLEMGSLNVNGSVRPIFCDAGFYVGIDMLAGRGVDVRALASWLPFPDETFDLVVSTEMLEHDLTFWFSLQEAWRVLKSGGRLLLTCRGLGFPQHEFPSDYYRFTPAALAHLAALYGFGPLGVYYDPQYPGVFLDAAKQ